jgi:hypothetical protein
MYLCKELKEGVMDNTITDLQQIYKTVCTLDTPFTLTQRTVKQTIIVFFDKLMHKLFILSFQYIYYMTLHVSSITKLIFRRSKLYTCSLCCHLCCLLLACALNVQLVRVMTTEAAFIQF